MIDENIELEWDEEYDEGVKKLFRAIDDLMEEFEGENLPDKWELLLIQYIINKINQKSI